MIYECKFCGSKGEQPVCEECRALQSSLRGIHYKRKKTTKHTDELRMKQAVKRIQNLIVERKW